MTELPEGLAGTTFEATGCRLVDGENVLAARARGSAASCAEDAAMLIRQGDMVRAEELLDSAQYYLGRWKDKR